MDGHLLLGSNLSDPATQLDHALATLPGRGIEVTAVSSYYETAPVGDISDQPPFLNAAAAIRTDLSPHDLLDALKRIESDAGREVNPEAPAYVKDGPRVLDLDIALLGDVEVADQALTVPHPRLLERRFALVPLLELDPELRTPGGARLADALGLLRAEDQPVQRI